MIHLKKLISTRKNHIRMGFAVGAVAGIAAVVKATLNSHDEIEEDLLARLDAEVAANTTGKEWRKNGMIK